MPASFLIYGSGGVGKSYIATSTSPLPLLVIDVEGSAHKLASGYVRWDGKFSSVTEDKVYVYAPVNYADFRKVIDLVADKSFPFKSLVIDSSTVLQKMTLSELTPKFSNLKQAYGKLNEFFETWAVQLQRMVASDESKLEILAVLAWQSDFNGKLYPELAPAVSHSYQHWFDITMQLGITVNDGKVGQIGHIMPSPTISAKATGNLYKKYGATIVNPNLTTLAKEM